MLNRFNFYRALSILLILISACNGNVVNKKNQGNNTTTSDESSSAPSVDINDAFLGVYHGVQQAYYLKNQYGDDMVVNGNKIPVPSIDFKFILKENGVVNLQQINLEEGTRVYYEGNFTVLDEHSPTIKITCNLSDGKSSNPVYTLVINNAGNTITCIGNNEPQFLLEKNEEENSASSNSATHTEEKNNNTEAVQNNDGVYSFHDNSVDLKIVIHGQTWTGKTTIITGMGEEYDKPEYQSGIVIGNDIYESSGNIKIGSINGRSLTTTISDSQVTLTK